MSKKLKDKLCAYCGINLSTSADHVFSRSLFCDPEIVNIPQVPACFDCNNEKSRLEHILSTILPFGGRHESVKKHLSNGKVGKRLSKNIPLKLKIKKELLPILFSSSSRVQKADLLSRLFAVVAVGKPVLFCSCIPVY